MGCELIQVLIKQTLRLVNISFIWQVKNILPSLLLIVRNRCLLDSFESVIIFAK